jgi:hypothetical protein
MPTTKPRLSESSDPDVHKLAAELEGARMVRDQAAADLEDAKTRLARAEQDLRAARKPLTDLGFEV